MPVFDLPLEELKKYQGTNPKPNDFDIFWDDSISEMKNINPDINITESDFQVPFAKCYDLHFTGINNGRIYSKMIKPINVSYKIPAVLKFHGYSCNSGDWTHNLIYAAMGYMVFAMDCRGQGGKSEDSEIVKGGTMFGHIVKGLDSGPKSLIFRSIFLDTAQLAGIVMNMDDVDENRVAVCGGSQGGALTIACAALEPRIKKLAPMYPFLSDYKRVWDMDLAQNAYQGITEYLRRFDPTHKNVDNFFNTLGYIDIQHLAKRIKGQVRFYTGLMDQICPPSTQFAIYNKITSEKEMIIYPDYTHEGFPGKDDSELEFFSDL